MVYNDALVKVFQLALILNCLNTIGAVGIEWKSIKTKKMDGSECRVWLMGDLSLGSIMYAIGASRKEDGIPKALDARAFSGSKI